MYKTQRQLEKLPPLRVPQRPFNRPANPEIGQLLKESNDLLNVCVLCWVCNLMIFSLSQDDSHYFAPKYYDQHVCMFVCPTAHVSQKPHVHLSLTKLSTGTVGTFINQSND